MNRILILLLAVVAALFAETDCHGQDWRDPALQQPLPQYYPPNRYPLDGPDELKEITPLATQAIPNPVTSSITNPPSQNILDGNNSVTARPRQNLLPETPITKRLPKKKLEKAVATGKQQTDTIDKGNAKKKTAKKSHPVINYDIYRDGSQFPIDPRKPCSVCRRPVGKCHCGADHGQCGPGNHGQPYQDREPGGYACGKNCPNKRPMFSVYWPRPFSAKHADGHPHRCNCDQCATRINDRFDHLIKFKLIDYQRTDNGYCGPGADPYGCLGESKYQTLGFGM